MNKKKLNLKKLAKKLNLKEFDLEAAKAGKPVCTKDGRKARIICFIKALMECDAICLCPGWENPKAAS